MYPATVFGALRDHEGLCASAAGRRGRRLAPRGGRVDARCREHGQVEPGPVAKLRHAGRRQATVPRRRRLGPRPPARSRIGCMSMSIGPPESISIPETSPSGQELPGRGPPGGEVALEAGGQGGALGVCRGRSRGPRAIVPFCVEEGGAFALNPVKNDAGRPASVLRVFGLQERQSVVPRGVAPRGGAQFREVPVSPRPWRA